MADLSPTALVVDFAIHGPGLGATRREIAAAALKAFADRVVPDEEHPGPSQFWDHEANQEWQTNQAFRRKLLAIAAELEGSL